jgi:trimethylamine:corrinoid methyltransferase-like protein
MSPVTIPAALVQQLAEAFAGISLAQLIRPGCPVIFGSFLSNIDMQSGSPSFGTPESAMGLLCTLDGYEAPPIDDAIQAELSEFVTRRRREPGD